MSGSGGVIGGGSGGFGSDYDNCSDLTIETQIISPKENVIGQLTEGTVLDVSLLQEGAESTVALLYREQRVGGVLHALLSRLRECIANGTIYKAHVLSIDEGQVRIRIKAQRP